VRSLSVYPKGFYGGLVATLVVMLVSGVFLVPSLLEMRLDLDVPVHLNGADRLAYAAIHALAGFLFVGFTGALVTVHMRAGWRSQRNHLSGFGLVTLIAGILLSTIGIYYAGNEALSIGSSVGHLLLSALAVFVFGWHFLHGRLINSRKKRSAG